MATVTVTVYPTGHATVGGTWSNPGNIYTDNGRLTTISPTRNDTGQILNVTFPSAELPAEAEIASVSAQIEWRASRKANLGGGIQAGYDGALRGTEVMDSAPTANTDRVFTNTDAGVWTAAELNSGLAYAAVRAYRSIGILTTISFDYACLIVEYTMPEEEPQEYHKAVTTVSGVLADTTKGAGKNVRATTLLSTGANKGFLKTLVTGVAAAVTAAKVHLQDTVSHVKEAFTTVSVASSAMRAFVKVVTTAVDGVSNIVKRTSKAATTAVHVGATAGRAIAKTVRAIVVVPAKAVKHVGKAAKTCVAAKPRVIFPFASLRYAAVSWEERETALMVEQNAVAMSVSQAAAGLEVKQGVVVLSVTEAHTELEVI